MSLNDIWFVLFVVIIAGYLILDGFDMGVGILHLPLARTDVERRTFLNSIGPVWDGNEVWLVLGGGVLFAVFPLAYASLFSGFYLAFMLVLLVMILRTVALEFRTQGGRRRAGGSTWDAVFGLSSLGLALLLGVAFGNVLSGRAARRGRQHLERDLLDLLTPFALLVGVTTVAMFAMHGAIYLSLKTEGELQARIAADRAPAHDRVLRAQHARRGRAGRCSTSRSRSATTHGHLAGHLPGRGARRAGRRLVSSSGAARRFRAFVCLVGDDRAAARVGRGSGSTRTCSSRPSTRPTT